MATLPERFEEFAQARRNGFLRVMELKDSGATICGTFCQYAPAEIIRAALESVPKGQLEAGYCVGMSYLQTMRRIILPQALRTAFPSLSNSLIAMVKDTSLAANITVTEMFMATQRIVARTYEPLALYIEVGVIYLMFSTVLTWLQRLGEKKLDFYGYGRN